jgi:hypothetical protein
VIIRSEICPSVLEQCFHRDRSILDVEIERLFSEALRDDQLVDIDAVRNVALQVCDRFRATNQLLELDLNAPRPEVTASTTGMPAIRIDAGVAPVTTSPRGGVWDTLRGFFGGA